MAKVIIYAVLEHPDSSAEEDKEFITEMMHGVFGDHVLDIDIMLPEEA